MKKDSDPSVATPIEVIGTQAWVVICRDYPLSSIVMTYVDALDLYTKLGVILKDKGLI